MKNKIITFFMIGLFLISLGSVFAYMDLMEVSNYTGEAKYVINDKEYNKSLEIHQQQDNLAHNSGMNKIKNFINKVYNYLFKRNNFKITKEGYENIEYSYLEYDCVEKITTTTDSICPDCVIWMDDKKNLYVDWIVNNKSQILKREIICRKELSKRDLNVNWLKDNCEFIQATYPSCRQGDDCGILNPKYLKYECGENYIVEVNR